MVKCHWPSDLLVVLGQYHVQRGAHERLHQVWVDHGWDVYPTPAINAEHSIKCCGAQSLASMLGADNSLTQLWVLADLFNKRVWYYIHTYIIYTLFATVHWHPFYWTHPLQCLCAHTWDHLPLISNMEGDSGRWTWRIVTGEQQRSVNSRPSSESPVYEPGVCDVKGTTQVCIWTTC